jgi:DNA-binding response OmpR family regulator
MEKPKKRILCVDDDLDTCQMVETLLRLSGYEVTYAMTVADGSTLAKKGGFDLYLLDWYFPDGSGIELCQYIRMFDATTPILFCSGAAYETDIKRAMGAGAQGYLVKPTDVENLIDSIQSCLATTGLQSRAS